MSQVPIDPVAIVTRSMVDRPDTGVNSFPTMNDLIVYIVQMGREIAALKTICPGDGTDQAIVITLQDRLQLVEGY